MSEEYLPQLRAALDRHEEAENWATLGAVQIACLAVTGDKDAQDILDTDPSWQLYDGELPATSL